MITSWVAIGAFALRLHLFLYVCIGGSFIRLSSSLLYPPHVGDFNRDGKSLAQAQSVLQDKVSVIEPSDAVKCRNGYTDQRTSGGDFAQGSALS